MADFTIDIEVNASDVKPGVDKAKAGLEEVEAAAGKANSASKSLANDGMKGLAESAEVVGKALKSIGLVAGAAIGALVAAASAAYAAIKRVTAEFASQAVAVGKMQQQTGLAAVTVSALEMQFRRTKTSGDDFRDAVQNLTKAIGDAANGSKEAAAKLTRLGLDPVKAIANLDGALRTVLQKIISLKNPVEQANAAMDAFGSGGYKLLPFIKSFNGDLDGLINKAKELGVTMSEDDVRAAVEYQAAMADLNEIFNGFVIMMGREFMPTIKQSIDDMNRWFNANRDTISAWAASAGDAFRGFIAGLADMVTFIDNHPTLTRVFAGIASGGLTEMLAQPVGILTEMGARSRQQSGLQNAIGRVNPDFTIDFSNGGMGAPPPPAPPSGYYPPTTTGGGGRRRSAARVAAPKISDEAKQAEEFKRLITDLDLRVQFFGETSEESSVRQQLLRKGIFSVNQELADQAIKLAKVIDKKKEDADRTKFLEQAEKDHEKRLQAIKDEGFQSRVGVMQQIQYAQQQLSLGRELTLVEKQRIDNTAELVRKTYEWTQAGLSKTKIDEAQAQLLSEQEETLKRIQTLQALLDRIRTEQAGDSLLAGLTDELAQLNMQLGLSAELSRQDAVAKQLQTAAYAGLDPKIKEAIINTAAQIDAAKAALKAQSEAQKAYDTWYSTIRDSLGILAEQGFGAFFKNIYQKFRSWLLDMAAQWLTSKFFKLLSGIGPGGAAGSGAQSGGTGGLQQIFQSVFGAGGSSAGGGWGNSNSGSSSGGLLGSGVGIGMGNNSSVPGMSGGTGSVAQSEARQAAMVFPSLMMMAGSVIPGKLGKTISYAGMGMAMGMMFGPVGSIIGTGIGALIGLLGGDPKKKKDRKENMPKLQEGFRQAIADLERLKNDRMAIYNDPDGTLSRARDIRAQIAAGFGIEFLSKKYQKIARQQIATKLIEADKLIAELEQIAGTYKYARQIDERIVTSFAGGVFMSSAFMRQYGDFKRRNGFLGGRFTGSDTLPSMLAPGEMVLNPYQVARVKANAGMDPFASAGIPGYASGSLMPSPSAPMSGASLAPSVVVAPRVEITIEGEGITAAKIKSVVVDGMRDTDFQVELAKAAKRGDSFRPRSY